MSENTNTARHTPGPWVLTDNGLITAEAREGKVEIAVIELDFDNPFESEQRANAKLIAAAPELLAALNRAEAFIVSELDVRQTSYGSDGDDGGYIGEARSALEIVRAAIAKARGK
jgi:hypothetical protein